MTEEELEKNAKNYAEEQEKNCTLGVYDNTEDLEYDRGYNTGYVIGLEEGYIAGAVDYYKNNLSQCEGGLQDLLEHPEERRAFRQSIKYLKSVCSGKYYKKEE